MKKILQVYLGAAIVFSAHSTVLAQTKNPTKTNMAPASTSVPASASQPAANSSAPAPASVPVPARAPETCAAPTYEKTWSRLGLQGATKAKISFGATGQMTGIELLESSGWKELDKAAINSFLNCKFLNSPNPATVNSVSGVQYVWSLVGVTEPEVIREKCAKSRTLRLAEKNELGRGVVVGVFVKPSGMAHKTYLQYDSGKKELDEESIRIAQSCRYTPTTGNSASAEGNPTSLRFFSIEAKK